MEITAENLKKIQQLKKGDVVEIDSGIQKAVFVGIAANIRATLFFENGNFWDYDFERIALCNSKSEFSKKLKLRFYGIKDFRRNFSNFL